MSKIGTYCSHEIKLQAVSKLKTPIRRGIVSSGTRLFLTVTETLAGTLVGLKKHKHLDRDNLCTDVPSSLRKKSGGETSPKTLYYLNVWNRVQNY